MTEFQHITSFDGTNIYYKIHCQSEICLVFLHGWANDWTTWKKEILFLEKKGYSTLTLDLRGHGQSDKPQKKSQYALECFAKDIDVILRKEKINRPVLIGHSLGGMIALTFYKLFPHKAGALVLCDTTAQNILKHKKVEVLSPFVKHVLDFIIKNEEIHEQHFSHLRDIDLTQYQHASDYFIFYEGLHMSPLKSVFACFESMMNYNVTNILKTIKVPVLIIEGAEDKLVPAIDAEELYEEIPNAELDFIPKGKHFVNLKSPKFVDKFILHFLRAHSLFPKT